MAAGHPFGTVGIIVCDSLGCGGAPDAREFGDEGANTLAHVVEASGVHLPHLAALGAARITGVPDLGPAADATPRAAYGRLCERAPAKDTMAGHWELMGVVAPVAFPTYPDGFPDAVIEQFEVAAGTRVIGNCAASGTVILDDLGAQHLSTGFPIVYTSGDSVFQVAAHVDVMPVDRLHDLCAVARGQLQGKHGVGRVIARPFAGPGPGQFERLAAGRRDFAMPPPRPTLLDALAGAGFATHAIGKIHDIFAGRGITDYQKTGSNQAGIEATCEALRGRRAPLIFTNLVDFDSKFGHRNDPAGYAAALAEFDRRIPELLDALPADGILVLTADHGNDPTWPGTDHTREAVPLLACGQQVAPADLGTRGSFADLAATVAANFGLRAELDGASFLDLLRA